jgi:drug/metabolite transporter (DMT)-like permease
MTTNSTFSRGYMIALISAAFLSTTAIFIRYLTETYDLPPLVLAFWRDVFVALTLLVVIVLRRQWSVLQVTRSHMMYLVVYGLVLSLFNTGWTLSVAFNGASVATVLAYCSAAFTALLGWWLLHERLDLAKWIAITLCLFGCALVADALNPDVWQTNLLGILTGMLSGLCYASYSLMGRTASQRGLNPWSTLIYTFSFAALFLLLFTAVSGLLDPDSTTKVTNLFWLDHAWKGWIILFALAAGPTVAGFGLYNLSLSYLPSSIANLVATSEPAFTAMIAYVLLGERLTLMQIMGSLVLISGVVFLRIYEGGLLKRLQSATVPGD